MSRVLIFATGCKLLQLLNLNCICGESGWEVAGLPVKTLQWFPTGLGFTRGSTRQSVKIGSEWADASSFLPFCNYYSGKPAPLAQLDRASGYEPEGREFESLRAHHFPTDNKGITKLGKKEGSQLQAPYAGSLLNCFRCGTGQRLPFCRKRAGCCNVVGLTIQQSLSLVTLVRDVITGKHAGRVRWRYSTVHSGDTLAALAHTYRTTGKAIEEANHLDGAELPIDAKLIIPVTPKRVIRRA